VAQQELTLNQKFKGTQMIFVALMATQLMFAGAAFFLVYSGQLGEPDYTMAIGLQQLAMLLVPGCMAGGYFLYKSQIAKIDRKLPAAQRLVKYQSIFITRAALFEVPVLFLCVCAMVTRELLFLYIAPIVFLAFVLLRPTVESVATDLELSPADRKKLSGE
jgi:hypothetical protein